jgi:hypothetical protein
MALYEITSPEGVTYQINGPDGATQEEIVAKVKQQLAPPDTSVKLKDVGAGLVTAAANLGQLPGNLYTLATGEQNAPFPVGPLTEKAKELGAYGASLESPELKAAKASRTAEAKQARASAMAEEEPGMLQDIKGLAAEFGSALTTTASNPSLITNLFAETLPQMLPALAAARTASGLSMMRSVATGTGKEAATKAAVRAGTIAAVGTSAVQQGTEVGIQTYKDMADHLVANGMSRAQAEGATIGYAQAAGATSAFISLLTQALPITRRLEESFAGKVGTGKGIKDKAISVAKTTVGESGQEMVEEGGGEATKNFFMQKVKPEQGLLENVGTTAALGAIGGGGAGAAVGSISELAAPPAAPVTPPPPAPPAAPPAAPEAAPVTPPPTPPAAPVEPKKAAEAPGDYYTGSVEDQGLSLKDIQNRDRSGPASIAQMQAIAAKPDYNQVSISNTLDSGAPVVVADTPIPENRMGKVSNVSTDSGAEIPIQYAVVEAADLTPSHDASGAPNKDFADKDMQSIRPIDGNGRVAGLQQAYINDTATDYKAKLLRDDDHGIDPVAIYTMDNPILVRVMPKNAITPDIVAPPKQEAAPTEEKIVEPTKPEVVEPPKQEELGTSRIGMGHKEAAKRIPELEAGAKKVAAGEMTKPEYEVLVNKYKKIEPYEDVPVPATPEKAVEILKEPQKEKFGIPSATLKDGDSVGIRLDIPAYTNHGVWISTVHNEGKGVKPGTVIGYEGSTAITNPKFVMSEKGALSIAEGGNKGVLATINGSWNPLSKEEIAAQAKAHLKDPEWAQVGMDPERHSYYYDKTTLEPIVSGSEMLQVGPLILVKNPVYAPKENFLFSLSNITRAEAESLAVSPIVKVNALYKLKKARKLKEANKINDAQFEDQISDVISLLEQAKERGKYKGKVRGPNWIRAKLRTGVHNGTISEGEARFVEWLLDQNPNLAHDLAIRITTKEGKGAAGQYSADGRLMTLFASNMNEGTAVHEILHHTERMMPEDVQEGIKKEWAAAWTKAYKNATPEVQAALDDMLLAIAGDTKAKERVMEAFKDGTLDIDTHYQLFGPSEYWAVNGTRILAARNKADTWVKKAWQWLKELVQRIKGLLGLRSDTPILKALSAILKSSGEFVSKNTLTQSEINFSLAEGDPAKSSASWNSPEPTQLDNIIFKYQNKFIDLKRVQEEILESGATIPDRINVYQKETLYHGATGTKTDEFVNKELGPLMRDMKARNVTTDQLETYLHARHAEEANIRIATINPDDKALQDGGSGMSTADAKKYLAGLGKSEKANLEPLAAKVDAILEKTRQLYVDEKLVSAKQVDSWRNMFKHYIPLMREDNDGGMGVGQGFSIKGKEVKSRTGSKTKVVNILGNIALQRERVITRAGKNDTAKALAGLVVMNPNPEFWTFDKTPMKRELIKAATFYSVLYHGSVVQTFGTNRTEALRFIAHQGDDAYTLHKEAIPEHVAEVANTNYKQADNVVVTKIEDADGQINEHAIIFNEKNPNAMRLARTLKNLDGVQLEGIMATFAAVTRYFASINTQYNPIFGIINLIRDVQGSLINLSSTALAGKQKEVFAYAVPALRGIYKSVRADRRGEDTTNVMGKRFKEMQLTGGMTGYRDLYKNSDDRSKAIEGMLNPQGWQQSKTGKIVTINGRLNVPTAIAQKNLKIIFDWLSDYNLAMEGAIRLSVYQVGLDNGLTKEQAASAAKNISVNFNRKGDVTTQASALFAFFNASMQGTARIAETLTNMEKGDIKTLKISKIGKKAIAGGLILGSVQAILLAMAGFDDEDPKEFVREKNLILPLGIFSKHFDKKYVMLPMPLGFNAIPNLGRITTEYALGGFKSPGKYTTKIFSMLADTFNPLGSAGFSLQTVAPTAVDPLVALDSNKDWTGQTIAREDHNKMAPTPGFKRSKDVASSLGIAIAEAINWLTFGTDYTPGKLSPTGDQIDYLAGQVTGGIGREIGKLFTTTKSVITGEEAPVHRWPLIARFYGDAGAQSSQANSFYTNIKATKEIEGEVMGRMKETKFTPEEKRLEVAKYIKEHPEYKLIDLASAAERDVSELRTFKRTQVAAKKPREEIKKTEEKITKIMTTFNNRVRQAEKDEIRAKK